MKRPLRHCDIVQGRKYKVIKKPDHLSGVQWPWLGMIGECRWSNPCHGVNMLFGGCKERLIPCECLEEVEEQQKEEQLVLGETKIDNGLLLWYANAAKEQQRKEEERRNSVDVTNVRLDNLYRIVKVPEFWLKYDPSGKHPSLGQIGRLIKIHRTAGTLKLGDGTQRFVPFECMEAVRILVPPPPVEYRSCSEVMDLSDDKLMDAIIANPRGALRIVKGLAKMNKEPRLVAFVQRGILA